MHSRESIPPQARNATSAAWIVKVKVVMISLPGESRSLCSVVHLRHRLDFLRLIGDLGREIVGGGAGAGELVLKPAAVVALKTYSEQDIARWEAEDTLSDAERARINKKVHKKA